MSHSVSQELYLIWLWFLVHMCKMMISPAIFFCSFKILIFRFFQTSPVNAKKEILRCAPPSSHVWFFFCIFIQPFRNFICNIILLANWQDSNICTYQISFQMFYFSPVSYQFTSMSSKLIDLYRSTELDSKDDSLWNSCQNLF